MSEVSQSIREELEPTLPTFREANGTPLQYSCLENPMDGVAWWAAVHGVAKSRTQLSDFTFTFHFHALEKEMATHSNVLAWRIPGTREPGGLPSMGSHRVGHDWSDLAATHFGREESQKTCGCILKSPQGGRMLLCPATSLSHGRLFSNPPRKEYNTFHFSLEACF